MIHLRFRCTKGHVWAIYTARALPLKGRLSCPFCHAGARQQLALVKPR